MKYINDIDIANKRVFIRCDFNVPMDENGNITDDNRIKQVLTTIEYAIDNKAKVILASHLGRPKGKKNPQYSLEAVAKRLSRLLNRKVEFVDDCIGNKVISKVNALKSSDVLLLENLRFYEGEEKNSQEFAKELLKLFDVYINDAFGVCHRKHTSVYALAELADVAGGGFLLKRELEYFDKVLNSNQKPFVAVIGGAKVSGKLECLMNLIDKADKIIIGGAQAFTFLKAIGYEIGKSLIEEDLVKTAFKIMQKAKEKGVKFYLPVDFVCSESIKDTLNYTTKTYQEIPDNLMGLDIGEASCTLFEEAIQDAKTIVWNGPMGVFEVDVFANGTKRIAKAIGSTKALSVVGGGDTAEAVEKVKESENMSYISTGGGASLKLLEGKTLPAIKVLEEKG
jgi:phosphoglycerate kinase